MASKVAALVDAGTEVEPASVTPVISVQNLVHRYENRTALNGVSFDVRPAELFGLLGPNGSGKTTLFRILSTLMIPTGGHALVMGCDAATDASHVRRQIGVVFQAQSVDPKLTAYENLWHQGHLYGLRGPSLKKRIGEILARVGLADRANERVETFSGGCSGAVGSRPALETVIVMDRLEGGLDQLDRNMNGDLRIADTAKWNRSKLAVERAPVHQVLRGSLGHGRTFDGTISRYQAVVPSTWNAGHATARATWSGHRAGAGRDAGRRSLAA